MIKQFNGFEEKAAGTFGQLPPGCYVITIKQIKYVAGAGGASDRIDMAIDILEGEQAGFFKAQYDASTDEDKRWKGKASIWIPDGSGSDSDKRSVRNFNSFAAYLAAANPGYHWNWDEQSLKDKTIGAAFRTEYNLIAGKEVSYTAFAWFCSADDVRSGKAKTPNPVYKNGATGVAKPAPTPIANEGFMTITTTEESIPF